LRRLGGIPFLPAGGGALIVIAKIFKEPFRGNITTARLKVNGILTIREWRIYFPLFEETKIPFDSHTIKSPKKKPLGNAKDVSS